MTVESADAPIPKPIPGMSTSSMTRFSSAEPSETYSGVRVSCRPRR